MTVSLRSDMDAYSSFTGVDTSQFDEQHAEGQVQQHRWRESRSSSYQGYKRNCEYLEHRSYEATALLIARMLFYSTEG